MHPSPATSQVCSTRTLLVRSLPELALPLVFPFSTSANVRDTVHRRYHRVGDLATRKNVGRPRLLSEWEYAILSMELGVQCERFATEYWYHRSSAKRRAAVPRHRKLRLYRTTLKHTRPAQRQRTPGARRQLALARRTRLRCTPTVCNCATVPAALRGPGEASLVDRSDRHRFGRVIIPLS